MAKTNEVVADRSKLEPVRYRCSNARCGYSISTKLEMEGEECKLCTVGSLKS